MLKAETIPLTENNLNLQISHSIKIKTFISPIRPNLLPSNPNKYDKNDFETLQDKSIGSGTFGSVWKVRNKKTNEINAIKVINKEYIIKQNMTEQIKKEIEIMSKLNHPHIIKLYSHFEDNENFFFNNGIRQ